MNPKMTGGALAGDFDQEVRRIRADHLRPADPGAIGADYRDAPQPRPRSVRRQARAAHTEENLTHARHPTLPNQTIAPPQNLRIRGPYSSEPPDGLSGGAGSAAQSAQGLGFSET
jgi:hypothetical protein